LGHKPISGETPIFDGTVSGNNCSWDYAIPDLAAITLQGTGGGAVTQAAAVGCGAGAFSVAVWTWNTGAYFLDVGPITLGLNGKLSQTGTGGNITCTSYTQSGAGSVLTGKVDAWFYCSGDFIVDAGTVTISVLKLEFSGQTLKSSASRYESIVFKGMSVLTADCIAHNISIRSGSVVSITSGKTLNGYGLGYSSRKFVNYGIVKGQGTLSLDFYSNVNIVNYGTIDCNTIFTVIVANAANLILKENLRINNAFTVRSSGTEIIALDLAGYSLACTSLTVGTRGVLLGGEGVITVVGAFDSSAGTFTEETSTVVMNGDSTIKLGAGQKFYNLVCSGARKILSDVTIDNLYAHINPMDLGGFALTLTKPEEEYTGLRRPVVKATTKLDIGPVGLADGWLQDLGAVI
ncbi:MAG: hypothetical protein WC375_07895, partial [Methanomassiliicoccales archaeon]